MGETFWQGYSKHLTDVFPDPAMFFDADSGCVFWEPQVAS